MPAPQIRARFSERHNYSAIGREFGISFATVRQIVTRRTWQHVP